ncbi:hypothetical protein NQ317_002805 [Molorchus minor]|uniref:Cuticle protein CPCFC domain-containing protein n=1 Tax=Molorchus minor TaxID=1323400 RepID=A0ABQ9JQ12_9CUCU|nr:hypothetical protein NQ317_002805 [Molorchus minor]
MKTMSENTQSKQEIFYHKKYETEKKIELLGFDNWHGILTCVWTLATAVTYGPIQGQVSPKYPAGIDPSTCPNFPYCANPLVAVSQGLQSSNTDKSKEFDLPVQFQIAPSPAAHQQPPSQYSSPKYHIKLIRPATPQYQSVGQHNQGVPEYKQPVQYTQNSPQYESSTIQQGPPHYPLIVPYQFNPNQQSALHQKVTPLHQNGDYHGEGLAEALTPGYELNPSVTIYQKEAVDEQQKALNRGDYAGDGDYQEDSFEK